MIQLSNPSKVEISVPALSSNTSYTITVKNVQDDKMNVIALNSKLSFLYVEQLINNLSPARYAVAQLQEGDQYYLDRSTFTLSRIPDTLAGAFWIKAENEDKKNANLALSFSLDQAADVYVAVPANVTTPANWITQNFTITNFG